MQKFSEQTVNANDVTLVSKGTVIKGDIVSATDIRVDGGIDGTVYSKGKIVVGESASLAGNLLCSNLDLWGKMNGSLCVKNTLSIKSTASVLGNIHANRLQVEMGAQINGGCRMISEQEFEKQVASVVKQAPKSQTHDSAAKPASGVKQVPAAGAPKNEGEEQS